MSRVIYENSNQLVEKWFNIFIRLVMFVTLPGLMFPTFIVSYFKYFTSDLGNDAFEMPYPIWLPINWRDPIKYFLAFCFQYSFAVCFSHIGTCTISFTTACCWMLISLNEDIKEDFHTFEGNAIHCINRAKLLNQFNEILEFQSDARQLSDDSNFFGLFHVSLSIRFQGLFLNFLKRALQLSDTFAFGVFLQ